MRGRNPLHEALHDQMGIDSFALDGDETRITESWMDRPRKVQAGRVPNAPAHAAPNAPPANVQFVDPVLPRPKNRMKTP